MIIKDYPAIFLKEEKCLVIAELHLGIEHELFNSGIVIPSQAKKFAEMINNLIRKTKAKKLVILGDIKHKVPGISLRERYEIPKFFSYLKKIKVILIKGNHDANLERILPKFKIFKEYKFNDFGFFHGHSWPTKKLMSCKYLFTSHLHPCIEISSGGSKILRRVWIKTKIDFEKVKKKYKLKGLRTNLIILPAFNPLVGGFPINKEFEKMSGVLKKFISKKNCDFFLLDGTFLGNLFF